MTRFCLRDKPFGLLKGWEQQGFGMGVKVYFVRLAASDE